MTLPGIDPRKVMGAAFIGKEFWAAAKDMCAVQARAPNLLQTTPPNILA